MQKNLKETEVIRLAMASEKNDRELFRQILNENSNRNVLLRGALGIILAMVYEQSDEENTAELILDQMLMDYTASNMELENGK